MNSAWSRQSGILPVLCALAWSAGCSFFYDLNTTQCELDKDCEALGPQFEGMRCINRVCVKAEPDETGGRPGTAGEAGAPEPGNTGGSSGAGTASGGDYGGMAGSKSEAGGTAGSPPDAGGSAGQPECEQNRDCIESHVDQPYICKSGKCVDLVTDECPLLLPVSGAVQMLRQDGAIVLGAFTTMQNRQDFRDTYGNMNWELALNEFSEQTDGGLPGYSGANEKRPLLLLVCQEAVEDVTPGMAHLSLDVGVPAVLSSMPADKLIAAFEYTRTEEYAEAGGRPVFFLSTGSANLALANLNDDGLVWHELGDPRILASTTAALVETIEPHVNLQRQESFGQTGVDDPDEDPLRVTLVYSDHSTMVDVYNVLTTEGANSTLRFNDKTCIEQTATSENPDGEFRVVGIESARVHETPAVSAAVTSVRDHPPHIIVAMATEEFADPLISLLEGDWGATGSASEGMQRPYYVLSHLLYNRIQVTNAALYEADRTPPLHERMVGVNYAQAQDPTAVALYTAYLDDLETAYPDTDVPLAGTENFYDAAYHLLYSATAAYDAFEFPDGEDIRDGFTDRVISASPTATVVNIGPSNIVNTVSSLTSSALFKMKLYATMGLPDFDRLSGTRLSAMSAWCIEPDITAGGHTFRADGLLYDSVNHEFVEPTDGVPVCLASY